MKIETLVEDIYSTLENEHTLSEDNLSSFLKGMEKVMREQMENRREYTDKPTLRMSSIGKPTRRLWMEFNNSKKDTPPKGSLLVKFLYGSILEELLIFLTREAGHSVTDEQKEVTLNGVKGHIDCKIDGELVDVKSTSDFAFRKFKLGTLENDDPFGYIGQISGYALAEGKNNGYFLAINKVTGEITLLEIDDFGIINANKRIDQIRKAVDDPVPPSLCYSPVPDGKSGNMKLNRNCVYCPFKTDCWEDLRIFKYKDSLRYLSKVIREPNVPEVTDIYA
jgi:hypothetical protein|tara:strand:- start:2847 stop:3683 length:837 start_codon:yes stop_codon:yes gene_type:complete